MLTSFRRARNLQRYSRIVGVLARHGFGSLLEYLQLDRYLGLPQALFRQRARASGVAPAKHLRVALEELGPTFIKLGQILSTRADLFPLPYIVELSKLQDSIPPQPWKAMRAVLLDEYGREPEQLFASIEAEPLGSASLAQVHAATLADGSQVVLKIQRPNIIQLVDSDLDILADLAGLVQGSSWGQLYNPVEVVAQFSRTLHDELDFRREGLNADRFRANFQGERQLHIPKVYWDVTTQRVLVLERLHGIRSDDLASLDAGRHDRREIAARAAGLIVKEMMVDGFFHADPHPGNFLISHGEPKFAGGPLLEIIGAMDFGMVGYVSRTDRLNLIQAFSYVEKRDATGLVTHLLRMGAITTRADLQELERDLDRMINQNRGLSLKQIQARRVAEDVMQIALHYRITLPPDLWLLLKTVIMMDGLARKLDPDFDIFSAFAPHVRRLLTEMRMPWVWGPALADEAESLAFAMKDIPNIVETILHSLLRGQAPFSFNIGANKPTLDRLDRLSTRISLSVLIAAFILGLALLLPLSTGNRTAEFMVIVGFVTAFGLGVWIMISILRSGR